VRSVYKGQTAAAGVALGRLHHPLRQSTVDEHFSGDVDRAFAEVSDDLAALAEQLRRSGQGQSADIVDTSRLIAEDPDLRADVDSAVATGTAPEAAVDAAVERQAALLAAIPDPTLAARAADVRAVGRRLVARLRGEAPATIPAPGDDPLIVAAHEVSADDLLTAGARLAGAFSVLGGAGAHAAIVARSLGVPLVVAVDPAALDTPAGTAILLDGTAGTLVVEPEPGERDAAVAAVTRERERSASLAAARTEPVRTSTGRDITVYANIGSVAEAELARAAGAPGVGLLRTEMPFLNAAHWPTAGEHIASLRPMLDRFAGRPVTVRTLDFGGDKLPPFLGGDHPRGLLPPDALLTQFTAILAAAGDAHVRIMIPMVSTVDELRLCRSLLAEVSDGTTPLGAMVETPGAIEVIDDLAAEADFLSIGSNDLTAALLHLDRRDPALTPARATEPVVRAAIEATVRAGVHAEIPVSVCGDAAADPTAVPLLVAAGCRILSVAPAALDTVRAQIRTL
jgi:multiphosphoryl transfer protein